MDQGYGAEWRIIGIRDGEADYCRERLSKTQAQRVSLSIWEDLLVAHVIAVTGLRILKGPGRLASRCESDRRSRESLALFWRSQRDKPHS